VYVGRQLIAIERLRALRMCLRYGWTSNKCTIRAKKVVIVPLRENRRASNRAGCTVDRYIERTVDDIYNRRRVSAIWMETKTRSDDHEPLKTNGRTSRRMESPCLGDLTKSLGQESRSMRSSESCENLDDAGNALTWITTSTRLGLSLK
jgi:hypothetical protein